MSHIEYFTQENHASLDAVVSRLEEAIETYLQLVYGESAELDSSASIAYRIGAVADVIEGFV
jgi:hypothetical protein